MATKKITKKVLDANAETTALNRIVVKRDDNVIDTRRDWDNLFKIWTGNNRHLANDDGAEDPRAYDGNSPEVAKYKKGVYALPLYAYIHSGMTVSLKPFNDPWDSGVIGFIYADKEKIVKELGLKRFDTKKAFAAAEGEAKALDDSLQGYCYGYVHEKRTTADDEWEEVNSCWGYLGENVIPEMLADAGAAEDGVIVVDESGAMDGEVTMEIVA